MNQSTYNTLKSFIWGIANDCLVDVYDVGDYRKIILPMFVIRRFDAVLEPKHDDVMKAKERFIKGGVTELDAALMTVAEQAFVNKSEFTLTALKSRTNQQQLKKDFIDYLDGFSQNVQDIINKFHTRNEIDRLLKQDRLGLLIEKFVDPRINLSNRPVLNEDGSVKIEALDNHTMGTLFEEVIRMFNEETYVTDAVLSITQQGIKEKDISSNEGQMAQSYANYQFVYPGDFAMNHMDLLTGYVDISKQFGVTSPDYRVFVLSDTEHCYAPFYLRVFQIGYKRRIFYKFGKGAANQGRWRLPKTAFYDFAIQVPPIEEQKIIEKKCKGIENKIDEMIFGLRKEIELVEELKVKLISDVVTGQVDIRNEVIPNYEVDSSDDEVEDDVDEESSDENIDEE